MKGSAWGLLAAGGWAAAIVVSCSSSQNSPFDAGDDGSTTEAGEGGGDDANAGDVVGFGDGSQNDACGGMVHCSADLHDVVDCQNHVVMTCPPSQGCAPGGKCVAACDAATANKSSIGCDYYPHNPHGLFGDGCYAVYLANTWNAPVTFTAEAGGAAIDVASHAYLPVGSGKNLTYQALANGQIPTGKVAILFLRGTTGAMFDVACPMQAASENNAAAWTDPVAGTGNTGQALHLTTSAPVVAYDILPYGGGNSEVTSATLLLPTSTWDTNYVAVTAIPQGNNTLAPSVAIVASTDNTDVAIVPTVDIAAGTGTAATTANTKGTYHLAKKGQVLRFEQMADLLGSVIQATQPIGVWGEQQCINIDELACDGAHQQIPPIKALGSEYVGVRYRNRIDNKEETPPWRAVGLVKGTTLTWEPSAPMGAPTTLDVGQAVTFRSAGPFVVKSQDDMHPFYLNAYMTGGGNGGCDGVNDPQCYDMRGDPEWVNVVPAKEFLAGYVFFTDPTYPETNLVFVRGKAGDGTFKDVNLDCVGNLSGWMPAGNSGNYEYTRVDLVRHDFAPQGNCDNGRHEAKSDGPFGITVWGWGTSETGMSGQPGYSEYVSYAYPAGASVQPINTVVVPPVPK